MEEAWHWPRDPHEYVFLARALDALGRQLWQTGWTGHEVVWGGRTIVAGFGDWMLRSMRDLPVSHPQRAFADKWLRGGGDDFLKLWGLAAQELENDPGAARAAEAAERLHRVEQMIAALFESGALASYGRPLIGGALSPIPRDLWRSEVLRSRWASFQIDFWHPFGQSSEPSNMHWIFVDRGAFRRVLSEVDCVAREAHDAADIAPQRAARGRPKAITDEAIRADVFRLMNHHGDFDPVDAEWNAQARLEEAIETKFGLSPSRTRERLKKPLEEWRRLKSGR